MARHRRTTALQRDREALSQAIDSARAELRELWPHAEVNSAEWRRAVSTLAEAERCLEALDGQVRRPAGRRRVGRGGVARPVSERVP